ncbi:O-antigen ligase family protein [Ureibacillus chungkukjangi]|nr:O-antigen ligase family protein [Ureibacillus chungkukjangi]
MKDSSIRFKDLTKIAFVNYLILIGLWVMSVFLFYIVGLREVIIFGKMLHYSEWFNDHEVFRFVSFMEYPNLIIMFSLFLYPLYYWHIKSFQNKILRVLLLLAGVLPIISTYSRSGYLIFIVGIIVFVFVYLYKKIDRKKFIILICSILSVLVLMFFYSSVVDTIYQAVEELLQAREGSNDSRTYLMLESIRVSFDNSPLIGMGIKDRSILGYPLGSHSTYIGFIYKTGIVGFVIGLMLFIVINIKILLVKLNGAELLVKISLILMTALFAVEDIDGSNWLIVLYFIFVGLLFNNKQAFSQQSKTIIQ